MRIAWSLASILLVAPSPEAGPLEPTPAGTGRFFLDGRPFSPSIVTPSDRVGSPEPGDVIEVGALMLTLGEESEYRFRSVREGLLLELPAGGTRWVGARVEPTYDDGPGFVDGLAALSEEEVRGLWGLRAEKWTASCVAKARWLDATRVFLELGQTGSEGRDDLPELPAGLRRLKAMRFVGWKSLARLRDLEYLDLMAERSFDLKLISGFQRLRTLELYAKPLRNLAALGTLRALETLELRYQGGVEDVAFARHLPALRHIGLRSTGVADLSPLSGLARLETIEASHAPVTRLPDGPLPALRSLGVMLTPLTDDAVDAFRRAHPDVRVRHRWNASLREALAGTTRVRLRPEPECSLEEASAPRDVEDPSEIAELMRILVFEELEHARICGCLGGTAIEFHQGEGGVETLQLVCGVSIRWSGWPADGTMPSGKQAALVDWLARHGVTGPREEMRETKARLEAHRRKRDRAGATMSPRLREAFESDADAADQSPIDLPSTAFRERLAAEVPLAADRIAVLLRVMGAEVGSWSGLDGQERMADLLLRAYPRAQLEHACASALRGGDRQLRRGAARFWDAWQSPIEDALADDPTLRSRILTVLQESRAPDLRQRAQSLALEWWDRLVPSERESRLEAGLHDPNPGVRRKAMLVAGQAGVMAAESQLLRVLDGETVEVRPLPPVPAEEEDTTGAADAIGAGASDPEIAAIALAYMRSRRALSPIEERSSTGASSHLRVARALLDERCDLLVADDFRTRPPDQVLQLAAVESVVRCRGRHGLDLALDYRSASHGWEPEHAAEQLRAMLLEQDAPGRDQLWAARDLERLAAWYQAHGATYVRRARERPTRGDAVQSREKR